MRTRTVLVIVTVAVLSMTLLAAAFQAGRLLEVRRCEARQLATAAAHEEATAALRGAAGSWADALVTREGEVVLRAFAAGIAPSIRAERRESLEVAAVSLLRVPGVEGIHVLRPDGTVVYSSDAKLATTGRGGERAAWALAASGLASRESHRPGVVELATPVVDGGRALAIVWLEFGHAAVREAARPQALSVPPGTRPRGDGVGAPAPPSTAP